jgi:hypothetical protein
MGGALFGVGMRGASLVLTLAVLVIWALAPTWNEDAGASAA